MQIRSSLQACILSHHAGHLRVAPSSLQRNSFKRYHIQNHSWKLRPPASRQSPSSLGLRNVPTEGGGGSKSLPILWTNSTDRLREMRTRGRGEGLGSQKFCGPHMYMAPNNKNASFSDALKRREGRKEGYTQKTPWPLARGVPFVLKEATRGVINGDHHREGRSSD